MSREYIRGRDNSVQFMIDEQSNGTKVIRNKHGELLGMIVNGQTRDKSGSLLSNDENIGLLMREDR